MKKSLFVAVILAAFLSICAIAFQPEETRLAQIEKTEGLFIFWECKPVDQFEVIGTVSQKGVGSNSYTARKSTFVEKAKKYHPDADGIYYDPDVSGIYDAFVIRFTK